MQHYLNVGKDGLDQNCLGISEISLVSEGLRQEGNGRTFGVTARDLVNNDCNKSLKKETGRVGNLV